MLFGRRYPVLHLSQQEEGNTGKGNFRKVIQAHWAGKESAC
jgi:hypothetical protein